MKIKILIIVLSVFLVGTLLAADLALAANYSWLSAPRGTNCDTTCTKAGQDPVYAGAEGSKSGATAQLFVCGVPTSAYRRRAQYSSGYVPGKNVTDTFNCLVPFNGKEYAQKNFACLCVPR
jgi:L-aminopeptidase/D-esterase-like protein